jgi:hypothetical protein
LGKSAINKRIPEKEITSENGEETRDRKRQYLEDGRQNQPNPKVRVEKFIVNGEQTEEELIQRAEWESGIPAEEIQVKDSMGRRITRPVQGQTAWIHYGGLKGGCDDEDGRVWVTINFELKQHHMWVDNKEHIREIMPRKRCNKAAVAPAGLNGKLEGPWYKNPVIKLVRRPDVKGVPVRLPKVVQEWNPDSRRVMVAVKQQWEKTRVKEIPCEMPLKKVLEWFGFNRKKITVKTKVQIPWEPWAEFKVMPREGVKGRLTINKENIEGKEDKGDPYTKYAEREAFRKRTERELDAMEERLRDADDQELRDIGEKAENGIRRRLKERPPGRAIKLYVNLKDFEWVEVEQNEDILSIMRKARYNPKVMRPRNEKDRGCGPWEDGQMVTVKPIRNVKWEEERQRCFTAQEEYTREFDERRVERIIKMLKEREEAKERAKSEEERKRERKAKAKAELEKIRIEAAAEAEERRLRWEAEEERLRPIR